MVMSEFDDFRKMLGLPEPEPLTYPIDDTRWCPGSGIAVTAPADVRCADCRMYHYPIDGRMPYHPDRPTVLRSLQVGLAKNCSGAT